MQCMNRYDIIFFTQKETVFDTLSKPNLPRMSGYMHSVFARAWTLILLGTE